MARPTNKNAWQIASNESYQQLIQLISSLSDTEQALPFDFSQSPSKKEAHWRRDKNVRDCLTHIYEWQQLLLRWVSANQNGHPQPFLPTPYNWRNYAGMNQAFFEKHQDTSLTEALELLAESHQTVANLAEEFTSEELFTKNCFPWVGGSTLGAYFTSATISHYEWARKKIKAHQKNVKQGLGKETNTPN